MDDKVTKLYLVRRNSSNSSITIQSDALKMITTGFINMWPTWPRAKLRTRHNRNNNRMFSVS